MKLTEHFSLEELTLSDTAVRLGIDNEPSAEIRANLEVLAKGLEQIRRALKHPVLIRSGYRCERLERVLCAKDFAAWCGRHGRDAKKAWPEYFDRKAHPRGYAADFVCPAFGAPVEIVRKLNAAKLRFDQLIEEGTWVHVSFDPRLRGELLTARFAADGTPSYSAGPA